MLWALLNRKTGQTITTARNMEERNAITKQRDARGMKSSTVWVKVR